MKNILITGGSGLVATRVIDLLSSKYKFIKPDLPDFDLIKIASLKPIINSFHPEAVIHFAAFTNVNEAEKQRGDQSGLCWQANVRGTKNILDSLDISKTFFINISTDMVFPGNEAHPGPYSEDAKPAQSPEEITWYAWTKLQAEKLLNLNKSALVRIIYPVRTQFTAKLDYLRGPLKKYDAGSLYPLFSDQIVSITFIDELAGALDKIIEARSTGIYHVSSTNTGTPHEIITYLLQKSRAFTGELVKSSVKQFPTNRYPWFGGLKAEATQKKLGLRFSTWQEIIDALISQGLSTA